MKPRPSPVRVTPSGEEVHYCPLCAASGHVDSSGHLYVDVQQGLYYCYRCGTGGTTASLRTRTDTDWPVGFRGTGHDAASVASVASVLGRAFGQQPRQAAPVSTDYASLSAPHAYTYTERFCVPAGLGPKLSLTVLAGCTTPEAYEGRTPDSVVGVVLPAMRPLVRGALAYLRRRGVPFSQVKGSFMALSSPTEAEGLWRSRIVLPSPDPEGFFSHFRARALPPWSEPDAPRYLGPRARQAASPLWWAPLSHSVAWSGLPADGEVVVVEGPFDALAVEARTGRASVALCGKVLGPGVAEELVSRTHGSPLVVLLDAAEPAAAVRAALQLQAAGAAVRVAGLPAEVKDPGCDEATPAVLSEALRTASRPCFSGFLRARIEKGLRGRRGAV